LATGDGWRDAPREASGPLYRGKEEDQMEKGIIQTFCQNCHMKCRIFVSLRHGKVQAIANAVDVEGAKTLPAYEEVIHPDRVIYPLQRTGKRGEGKWRRLSWDEALNTMAERFARIKETQGVEAVASLRG